MITKGLYSLVQNGLITITIVAVSDNLTGVTIIGRPFLCRLLDQPEWRPFVLNGDMRSFIRT